MDEESGLGIVHFSCSPNARKRGGAALNLGPSVTQIASQRQAGTNADYFGCGASVPLSSEASSPSRFFTRMRVITIPHSYSRYIGAPIRHIETASGGVRIAAMIEIARTT